MTFTTGLKTFVAAWGLLAATTLQAQEPAEKAPAAPLPILRLDAEGPLSTITSLAFSPDGSTLFAAGWDKAIYAWTLDKNNTYQFAPDQILRIPIGPQHSVGLINALAMSSDGRYLAAAGVAKGSHNAGFSEGGLMWPASAVSTKHLKESGTIYVFDLKAQQQPSIIHLRGHLGTVTDLTFPTHKEGQAPVLVSAGEEKNPKTGELWGAVRVWDLQNPENSIAAKFGLPSPTKTKTANMPRSIGAVRTGNHPKSVQVGIAWGDAFLRFWDVAQNNFVQVPNIASVACAGVGDQFLVAGGNRNNQWCLEAWTPPVKNNAAPQPVQHTFLNNQWAAPIGLATAADANRTLVVSAILPPVNNQVAKIGFFLADSKTLKRVPANAQTIEFGNMQFSPAYAISGDAKVVAVAGNQDRTIQVYRVGGNGNAVLAQTLESQGELYRRVRFFTKGDSLGLALNFDDQKAEPDLLFDITASQAANPMGWKLAPSQAKAKFTAEKGKQKDRDTVITKFPDGTGTTIVLPEDHQIKALDVCPQTENHPPLVGVVTGSTAFAESILRIFDAKTGQALRQFSGHTDNITSLAFSDNGKLMASAGLDRTVRVWWMEDLKDHIGESGFLNALKVQDLNNVATVEKLDAEVAAEDLKKQLQARDVIEGFTSPAKKFIKTPTAEHFFYYLSSVTPGQTVELQVRRNGQLLNPAPQVKVQQAIDERKPLFTLFFNQPGNAEKVSWIGWAPLGQFDSSDPQIEKLVGWHFNPVQPDAPSTYSQLSEYRKDHYYQKGFLKNMIDVGKPTAEIVIPDQPYEEVVQVPEPVPPIVEQPMPPVVEPNPPKPEEVTNPALAERGRSKPQLFLFVKEQVQSEQGDAVWELLEPNNQRRVKAQSKNLKAVLTVKDSPMPLSELKSHLKWQLGGQPQKLEVDEVRSGDFEVDLSSFEWKRQENNEPYLLYVSFTDEESSSEYFSERWIVYDPPQPKVEPMPTPPPPKKVLPEPSIIAPDSLTVLYDQQSPRQIPVRVELSPVADGEEVQAGQLSFEVKTDSTAVYKPLLQNGQPLTKPFDADTAKIEATVPLQNGLNQIRVQLKSNAGPETKVSNEVVIFYRRPPRVENLQVKVEKEHPRAEISCDVQTPADRPILEWRVLINRKMYIVPMNQVASQPKPKVKGVSEITLKNVLLNEGKNTVRVLPRNADGRVLSTPKAEVEWKPPAGPPPSRPKIYFKNVNDQVPLAGYWPGDEFTVAFNVLAEADLEWVKVYYNGQLIATPEIPKPTNGMKYEFTMPVKLAKDLNKFQVVALDKNLLWNEAEVPLSPLKPPVTLLIDQIDVPGAKAPMKPENSKDRVVKFPKPVEGSHIILRGRVITSDSTMKFGRPFVKCWVNGYLQSVRANLIPGKPTEWQFAMNVVLNQAENIIRLELPEAPKSPFSQTECLLKCNNPNTEQKLHLVVVGLDPKAPAKFKTEELKKQAAKAFGIDAKQGAFKDPEIHVLPRGDVRVDAITQRLMSIKASKQNPEKGEHDLVVFFYQGGEMQRDDQSVLLTFDGGPTQNLLTDQKLKSLLGEISGAHLLLLDVAQINQVPKETKTEDEPYPLGILRTVHAQGMPQNQEFPLMSVLDNVLPHIKELDELPRAVKNQFQGQPQVPTIDDRVPQVMKHTIVGTK